MIVAPFLSQVTVIGLIAFLVKIVTVAFYPAAASYLWLRSKETLTGMDQPS